MRGAPRVGQQAAVAEGTRADLGPAVGPRHRAGDHVVAERRRLELGHRLHERRPLLQRPIDVDELRAPVGTPQPERVAVREHALGREREQPQPERLPTVVHARGCQQALEPEGVDQQGVRRAVQGRPAGHGEPARARVDVELGQQVLHAAHRDELGGALHDLHHGAGDALLVGEAVVGRRPGERWRGPCPVDEVADDAPRRAEHLGATEEGLRCHQLGRVDVDRGAARPGERHQRPGLAPEGRLGRQVERAGRLHRHDRDLAAPRDRARVEVVLGDRVERDVGAAVDGQGDDRLVVEQVGVAHQARIEMSQRVDGDLRTAVRPLDHVAGLDGRRAPDAVDVVGRQALLGEQGIEEAGRRGGGVQRPVVVLPAADPLELPVADELDRAAVDLPQRDGVVVTRGMEDRRLARWRKVRRHVERRAHDAWRSTWAM